MSLDKNIIRIKDTEENHKASLLDGKIGIVENDYALVARDGINRFFIYADKKWDGSTTTYLNKVIGDLSCGKISSSDGLFLDENNYLLLVDNHLILVSGGSTIIDSDLLGEIIKISGGYANFMELRFPGGGTASLVINPDEDYLSLKEFIVSGQALTNLLYCDLENNKIGIGTGSPSCKLTIEDATTAQHAIRKTGGTTILIESGSIAKITAYDYTASAARKLYLQTDGADLIACSSGGNVGVNTTTPTSRLDVNGDIETTGSIYQGDPTTDGSTRTRSDGAGNVYHEVRVSGSWVLA